MTFRTITVGQLRRALDGEDADALVVFESDYGDHCHTMQALPLRGDVDEAVIRESGYSTSGFKVLDEDDEADDRDGDIRVVVIR